MYDLAILVGGRGKRLQEFSKNTPKPLITIDDRKFLDILISKIIRFRFKTIYLLCSYKKEIFFKKYHNKKFNGIKFICIDEGKRKDTGGALFNLKKRIKNNFILINGDTYFDIDFRKFLNGKNNKYLCTIALTQNQFYKSNNKISKLKLDINNFIKFTTSKKALMNGGIYFFNKKIFDYIPNKKISLEKEILPNLILNKKVKGEYFKNMFIDIGIKKNLLYIRRNSFLLKQKAFFLDRDGVINKLKKNDYIKKIDEFELLSGVSKAIKFLNRNNYLVIIVTNQACIGKSIISEKKLLEIHNYMRKKILSQSNGFIDDIFYAPYFKQAQNKKYKLNINDRKPNIGLFIKAKKKWNIDFKKSYFIGDSITDYEAAKKSNIKFFYKKNYSLYKQVFKIINS